ncbi:hypothetical protein FISHEDRAFT_70218 [Fistulina hepatica ATCC 64428]|uniref:Uncharacterized protein n=1 Tax=Fistulina hepatica ATCC 64428 TaxID=1128425 RepID=A0A0D7AL01_9AGAR|nr:hypothetical protein FISHEDRAFT_70218 [Fistulina hepatica ATCC 64428]
MYKRIDRKYKKRQEEEELGLDDDMKEVLGMHDTDSDESESDGDETDSNTAGASENEEVDVFEDGEASGGNANDDEQNSDLDSADTDSNLRSGVSVKDALSNPIHDASDESESQCCLLCPRKVLKGAEMVNLHLKSHAHTRRAKQITKLVEDHAKVTLEDDIYDVIALRDKAAAEAGKHMSTQEHVDHRKILRERAAAKKRIHGAREEKKKASGKNESSAKEKATKDVKLNSVRDEPSDVVPAKRSVTEARAQTSKTKSSTRKTTPPLSSAPAQESQIEEGPRKKKRRNAKP